MYRKKYKGKNHKVIKTSKVIKKEVYVAKKTKKKKSKFRLTSKFLFLIGGMILISIGLIYFRKSIKYQVLSIKQEEESEKLEEEESSSTSLSNQKEIEVEISPFQMAVLENELFQIDFSLKNYDFSGGDDIKIIYNPTSVKFFKLNFGEVNFYPEKLEKRIGEIIVSNDLILDEDFNLTFQSLVEGMDKIVFKLGGIKKEIVINVLRVEAENPNIVCSEETLETPVISSFNSGPEIGSVSLFWNGKNNGSKISVYYGLTNGVYEFGEAYIEDDGEFVVKNLKPGEDYFFSLQRFNNCNVSEMSSEIQIKAGYGALTKSSINDGLDLPVSYELIP